jgi:hypothetical protein
MVSGSPVAETTAGLVLRTCLSWDGRPREFVPTTPRGRPLPIFNIRKHVIGRQVTGLHQSWPGR